MTLTAPTESSSVSHSLEFSEPLLKGEFGIFRFDGKNFGNYTRELKLQFPEDPGFMSAMDAAALYLCDNFQSAFCAFVVSDEISLVLRTDIMGEFAYSGRITKIASLGAGMCSAIMSQHFSDLPAVFDGRGGAAQSVDEVDTYLHERHRSGRKNAISMAAENEFNHNQLVGVSTRDRLALLSEEGIEFDNTYSAGFRNGRLIKRLETEVSIPPAYAAFPGETKTRKKWKVMPYKG